MDLDLAQSHVQLKFNSKLPSEVLRRLKERKVKLRKFMLYVNSVLNGMASYASQPYLWLISISTLLFLLRYQHYLSSFGQIKKLERQSTHFVTSEPCLSHLLFIC